jgi:hypothetical protein
MDLKSKYCYFCHNWDFVPYKVHFLVVSKIYMGAVVDVLSPCRLWETSIADIFIYILFFYFLGLVYHV